MSRLVVGQIPNLLLDPVTFCHGLNVIVGEACSGKSRFLSEVVWALRECSGPDPVFLTEDGFFLHHSIHLVFRECESDTTRLCERRLELIAEEMVLPLLHGQLIIGNSTKAAWFASEADRYNGWDVQLNDELARPRRISYISSSASQKRLLVFHRLLQNNSINRSSFLFWDCPETFLTTSQQKVVARVLGYLASIGTKVFLVSKSLFFLRELDILLRSEFKDTPRNFMSVTWSRENERGIRVRQGESWDAAGDVSILQEELAQTDRYFEVEKAEGKH